MPTPGSSHRRPDGTTAPAPIHVSFRCYGSLNDFLPEAARGGTIDAAFVVSPSVKDAVERLGVPHVEVDLLVVNDRSVGLEHRLAAGDRVAVYPLFQTLELGAHSGRLLSPIRRDGPLPQFVADVHLRRLARLLRLLGLDVLYSSSLEDPDLVDISVRDGRVLLSRDRALLKHGRLVQGLWIRSVVPRCQVVEILRRFDLVGRVDPFTRCPSCNGRLAPVRKEEVLDRIPPKTARWLDEYKHCSRCGQLYWQGTHTRRIRALLEEIVHEATVR